jgi:type II secretory pathway pseudopilin PulG
MKHPAFTTIELMLVVILIGISMGMMVLFSQTYQLRADVNAQSKVIASYLRLAQSEADSGKGNSDHGIHFDPDAFIVFEGSAYSVSDPSNFEVELPSSLSIENISLNGGGSDIIFSAPFGDTTSYGSFDVVSETHSRTITVNALGVVSY